MIHSAVEPWNPKSYKKRKKNQDKSFKISRFKSNNTLVKSSYLSQILENNELNLIKCNTIMVYT